MNSLLLKQLPDGRRIFKNDQIQAAIDRAITQLTPEDHFAVVAHAAYLPDGTKIASGSMIVRLPAGFSVAVAAYKDFTSGDKGAEGQIVWRG